MVNPDGVPAGRKVSGGGGGRRWHVQVGMKTFRPQKITKDAHEKIFPFVARPPILLSATKKQCWKRSDILSDRCGIFCPVGKDKLHGMCLPDRVLNACTRHQKINSIGATIFRRQFTVARRGAFLSFLYFLGCNSRSAPSSPPRMKIPFDAWQFVNSCWIATTRQPRMGFSFVRW